VNGTFALVAWGSPAVGLGVQRVFSGPSSSAPDDVLLHVDVVDRAAETFGYVSNGSEV